jgi:hypothetical protein
VGRAEGRDNIKMNLKEIGLKGMEWINLAQERDKWQAVVYTVMNTWFP